MARTIADPTIHAVIVDAKVRETAADPANSATIKTKAENSLTVIAERRPPALELRLAADALFGSGSLGAERVSASFFAKVLITARAAATSTNVRLVRIGPAFTRIEGKKLGMSSAAKMKTAFIGMNCARVPVISAIIVKMPEAIHLPRVGGLSVGFIGIFALEDLGQQLVLSRPSLSIKPMRGVRRQVA